jgi:hyperosmotically inducible protein
MRLSYFSLILIGFTVFNVCLCAYAAQDAANTATNKTLMQNNELTARDQGNSKQDIEITRHIRQMVVADKTFSSSAKNVKIITQAGNVILKGPVQNAAEKEAIRKMAVRVAGKNHVSDEIEIIQ